MQRPAQSRELRANGDRRYRSRGRTLPLTSMSTMSTVLDNSQAAASAVATDGSTVRSPIPTAPHATKSPSTEPSSGNSRAPSVADEELAKGPRMHPRQLYEARTYCSPICRSVC